MGERDPKTLEEMERDRFQRVALRTRTQLVTLTAGTQFRGAYYRCAGCSWTWDEEGTEKHSGRCVLAPFGVVVGELYESVEGEPS